APSQPSTAKASGASATRGRRSISYPASQTKMDGTATRTRAPVAMRRQGHIPTVGARALRCLRSARTAAIESTAFAYKLRETIGQVIVGQRYVVDRLLIGLLAGGHVLLEGVPGLAKTLS